AGRRMNPAYRPYTLIAELTYKCPLRCVYCSNPVDYTRHDQELDTATWLRVFEEAEELGVVQLNLTGGEPLVRNDLEQLIANTQYLGWALLNRKALLPSREQLDRAREVALAARERLKGKMEVLFVVPDYYREFPPACMDGWGRRFLLVSPDGLALPCHVAHEI